MTDPGPERARERAAAWFHLAAFSVVAVVVVTIVATTDHEPGWIWVLAGWGAVVLAHLLAAVAGIEFRASRRR